MELSETWLALSFGLIKATNNWTKPTRWETRRESSRLETCDSVLCMNPLCKRTCYSTYPFLIRIRAKVSPRKYEFNKPQNFSHERIFLNNSSYCMYMRDEYLKISIKPFVILLNNPVLFIVRTREHSLGEPFDNYRWDRLKTRTFKKYFFQISSNKFCKLLHTCSLIYK